jgi:hypothetical protein
MKKSHNAAEQNVIDMDLARRQSTVNSALLTNYLYGTLITTTEARAII